MKFIFFIVNKYCRLSINVFIDKIFEDKPELEKLAYRAYFGNEPREKLTIALFNLYGSEGVIKFDFMASQSTDRLDRLGKSVLFDLEECLEFFSEGVVDKYLNATNQTKNLQDKFRTLYYSTSKIARKTPGKNPNWRVSYGQPLYNIYDSLVEIAENIRNLPLRDIFDNQRQIQSYDEFLNLLSLFNYEENNTTKIELQQLEKLAKYWESTITFQSSQFWSKHNQKPLFERHPYFRSNSILSSKQLENAYLAMKLMQGESL